MREPVTKVFRRAGCGKSARPVRRGDGESRLLPLLSVLLYRPIGLRFWSAPNKQGWPQINADYAGIQAPHIELFTRLLTLT